MTARRGLSRNRLAPADRLRPPERTVHVVCYDVTSARRRARVRKILLDAGVPVQYSVFECTVSGAELRRLVSRLRDVLSPRLDRLIVYPLCRRCAAAALRVPELPPLRPLLLIV